MMAKLTSRYTDARNCPSSGNTCQEKGKTTTAVTIEEGRISHGVLTGPIGVIRRLEEADRRATEIKIRGTEAEVETNTGMIITDGSGPTRADQSIL